MSKPGKIVGRGDGWTTAPPCGDDVPPPWTCAARRGAASRKDCGDVGGHGCCCCWRPMPRRHASRRGAAWHRASWATYRVPHCRRDRREHCARRRHTVHNPADSACGAGSTAAAGSAAAHNPRKRSHWPPPSSRASRTCMPRFPQDDLLAGFDPRHDGFIATAVIERVRQRAEGLLRGIVVQPPQRHKRIRGRTVVARGRGYHGIGSGAAVGVAARRRFARSRAAKMRTMSALILRAASAPSRVYRWR